MSWRPPGRWETWLDKGFARGSRFGADGTSLLCVVLRDVVLKAPDPEGTGSVYKAWRLTSGALADSLEPGMADLGGGSDFAGFYNRLGITSADWGLGGSVGRWARIVLPTAPMRGCRVSVIRASAITSYRCGAVPASGEHRYNTIRERGVLSYHATIHRAS